MALFRQEVWTACAALAALPASLTFQSGANLAKTFADDHFLLQLYFTLAYVHVSSLFCVMSDKGPFT